jgi:hypothetical protein
MATNIGKWISKLEKIAEDVLSIRNLYLLFEDINKCPLELLDTKCNVKIIQKANKLTGLTCTIINKKVILRSCYVTHEPFAEKYGQQIKAGNFSLLKQKQDQNTYFNIDWTKSEQEPIRIFEYNTFLNGYHVKYLSYDSNTASNIPTTFGCQNISTTSFAEYSPQVNILFKFCHKNNIIMCDIVNITRLKKHWRNHCRMRFKQLPKEIISLICYFLAVEIIKDLQTILDTVSTVEPTNLMLLLLNDLAKFTSSC